MHAIAFLRSSGIRNTLLTATVLALLCFVGPAARLAHAGVAADVDEILIGIIDQRTNGVTDEWIFSIEITAADVSSIFLQIPPNPPTYPNGETFTEQDFDQDGEDWELEFLFASLSELQDRFKTGNYTFTINGAQVILNFDPTVPDGSISVSFPPHVGSIPNGTPTFTTTTTCTNCNIAEALVEDAGGLIEIETNSFMTSPLPSSFPFSAFGPNLGTGGPISELPTSTVLSFCVLESVIEFESKSISGDPDGFTYVQERGNDDRVGFSVTTPTLASDVETVILEYAELDGDWYFRATVEGTGIASASVTPPNQDPVDLPFLDGDEFEYEAGPYASEQAMRAAYPPTVGPDRYVVAVDGGERFYSAVFDPATPDGGVEIVSPADGATVGPEPSFTVSNDCTNCISQVLAIESAESFDVGIDNFSDTMPFPTLIEFDDFGPNEGDLGPITELPEGDFLVELDTAIETNILDSFVPGDSFVYIPSFFREDEIDITVPEPGAGLLGLLSLVTLGGLARTRRGA